MIKPEPFNLKKALAGYPVVSRSGVRAVSIKHQPDAGEMCVFVRFTLTTRSEMAMTYDEHGRFYGHHQHSPFDLMMVVERKVSELNHADALAWLLINDPEGHWTNDSGNLVGAVYDNLGDFGVERQDGYIHVYPDHLFPDRTLP